MAPSDSGRNICVLVKQKISFPEVIDAQDRKKKSRSKVERRVNQLEKIGTWSEQKDLYIHLK